MGDIAFHIHGSAAARPASARTIFCDGSADESFRDGVDLELSHWIPNRTPAAYKADTSTEICLNFVARHGGEEAPYGLVVNDHVDIDGMLSVFVLVHGTAALAHRRTLVQAAEIGDFWAAGDRAALALFQALALHMQHHQRLGSDRGVVYRAGFDVVQSLLGGAPLAPDIEAGLAAFDASAALVEEGRIGRRRLGPRFVHYTIPPELARDALPACLAVPRFCAPLSDEALLWPQVRAGSDAEAMHLVSTATADGTYHDLWLPGYAWAETPHRWRVPGLASAGDSNVHVYAHAPLRDAVARLAGAESARGRWQLVDRLSPFAGVPGRGFPVVVSFVDGGAPAPSALAAEFVAECLAPAFADA